MAQVFLDWFEQVLIIKGAGYKLTVNYDACNFTLTPAGGGLMSFTSYNQLSGGGMCPVMVASFAGANNVWLQAAISVYCNVLKIGHLNVNSLPNALPSCRLYILQTRSNV